MQINPPSSPPTRTNDHEQPVYLPPCPLCRGSLVPLRNSYRCLRCSYHVCAGCEPVEGCSLHDE
jgi:hypothetical protein